MVELGFLDYFRPCYIDLQNSPANHVIIIIQLIFSLQHVTYIK